MRKIIIPAGGQALRFGKVLKEFAPLNIDGSDTTFKRSIYLAIHKLQASDIVIITNPEKAQIHLEYIHREILPLYTDVNILLAGTQQQASSVLEAIGWGLRIGPRNIPGGLLLPDTVTDFDLPEVQAGITFGTFKTTEPERFSIVHENTIYTKVRRSGVYDAWGVVLWSAMVGEAMAARINEYDDYDHMFKQMMHVFGYDTFPLDYYYDLGSIEHYLKYMEDNL